MAQLDPIKYNKGMIGGFGQVIEEEGVAALATGLAPTAVGYFIQGESELKIDALSSHGICPLMRRRRLHTPLHIALTQGGFKFGGVEVFKIAAVNSMGEQAGWDNRTSIYLGAAAAAEFIADVFLCPLEVTGCGNGSERSLNSRVASKY